MKAQAIPIQALHRTRFTGGVAQLGEHLLCKQGVIGSIPFTSTNCKDEGARMKGGVFILPLAQAQSRKRLEPSEWAFAWFWFFKARGRFVL